MTLYICCTPYQIFNSINHSMHHQKGQKCDLVILGLFKNAQAIADTIRNTEYFENVYYTEKPDIVINHIRPLIAFFRITFPVRTIQYFLPKFPLKRKKYMQIISSTYLTDLAVAFFNYYKAYGAAIYTIEDGAGSYYQENLHAQVSKLHRIYSKLINRGIPALNIRGIYAYEPAMLPPQTSEILRLSKINQNDTEFIALVSKIFRFNGPQIQNKIIYLDQAIPENSFWATGLKSALSVLKRFYGGKLTIIKHPKNAGDAVAEFEGFHIYPASAPWELIIANHDLQASILITVCSTACFTPKLIFDKEPFIIFLYCMMELPNDVRMRMDDLIARFQAIYSDPSKIRRPSTMKELEDILYLFNMRTIHA